MAFTVSVAPTLAVGSSVKAYPATGWLAFSTVNSGTTATNSWTGIAYELQIRAV